MSEQYNYNPLQSAEWADFDNGNLSINGDRLPIQMASSDGTGLPLLKNGGFGTDLIRFGASEGVAEHKHIGQHFLFVLRGLGVVKYDGMDNSLYPGKCYMVESDVPHAIYADKDDSLVLLVVGDDHRGLADPARMELTELGELERLPDGTMPSYQGEILKALKETQDIKPGSAYID